MLCIGKMKLKEVKLLQITCGRNIKTYTPNFKPVGIPPTVLRITGYILRVRKQWSANQIWPPACSWYIKFYWNRAISFYLHTFYVFVL